MARIEDMHVKIPALVHTTRLEYSYMSIHEKEPGVDYDGDTNIFYELFRSSLERINNTSIDLAKAKHLISEIKFMLQNGDLGEAFFNCLQTSLEGFKLIDFKNVGNNTFTVVTELPYAHDDDSFRPDIIFLVNGMPLGFMEVKRQNNIDGILAERDRMYKRFRNPIYRRFVNVTQLMAFSNNEEYDDESRQPIQGSFYASSAYGKVSLSHFREERAAELLKVIKDIDSEVEEFIVRDNNLESYYGTPEYISSIKPDTPANRIITSLFSPERLLFLLKYGICYVHKTDENGIEQIQKHVMRYPQLFATLAVRDKLDAGIDKGIIWHTQGSGKTALAFFLTRYLKDYYQAHDQIARFYFIVDRLDLLVQASSEFESRGVKVLTVQSRKEFVDTLQTGGGGSGANEITVINIQKFSEDSIAFTPDYNLSIKRVYFMDEAHRDYNPKGSFLANLLASDPNAVKIALTGTPLVAQKLGFNSKDVFGEYIHKYFYNQSIADGYTLRLLREEIQTEFKVKMQQVIKDLQELKSEVSLLEVFEHRNFVESLCDYIIEDYVRSQIMFDDDSIGAMIVAASSEQARAIFGYLSQLDQDISVALVLHDEGTTQQRKDIQDDFKKGKTDILVVYNMLLTGFDVHRLKKMYLCRKIKAHNLLQALTRVNRPYKDFSHGYVVDFVDITEEFDKTNQAYLRELNAELGDAADDYSSLFDDPELIELSLQNIKQTLFSYSLDNEVEFINEINAIEDKQTLYELRAALKRYKDLRNVCRMYGYQELYDSFDILKAHRLLNEVELRIGRINLKEALAREDMSTGQMNLLLNQLSFSFRRVGQSEMVIADEFENKLRSTFESFSRTLDPKDPEYVNLLDELRERFRKKNIEELTTDEMVVYIKELEELKRRIDELNSKDARLCKKYNGDAKFLRAHKFVLRTPPPLIGNEITLHQVLLSVKRSVDDDVFRNESVLDNRDYFESEVRRVVLAACKQAGITPKADQVRIVAAMIASEYEDERKKAS